MKVVFLARSLKHGGAERQLVTLAGGLRERGHAVLVLLFYGGGPLEQELHAANVPAIDLAKRGRWDTVGFLSRLFHTLRRERPDVLYSFLAVPNLLGLLGRLIRPRPRLVWGLRASDMDLAHYDRLARLTYGLEARFAHLADLIIVNSEAGRKQAAARGIAGKRLIVIPNGIDIERFRPNPEARAALRRALGLSPTNLVIGHAARFDPMKDHATFVKAASLWARDHPETRFLLLGQGIDEDNRALAALLNQAKLDGSYHLLGDRSDPEAVFPALDLFCLSSAFGEGFPNVLGEAMAAGVPCVTTDVGDAAAIVGDLGFVVPRRDPNALVEAWRALSSRIEREGTALSQAVRTRIAERFSRETMIRESEAQLAALFESGPGRQSGEEV